jgi:hypothetical protein
MSAGNAGRRAFMLGLVDAYFTTAGKRDHGDRTPTLLLYRGTGLSFPLHVRHKGLHVIAHQIELVNSIPAGMEGGLGRR